MAVDPRPPRTPHTYQQQPIQKGVEKKLIKKEKEKKVGKRKLVLFFWECYQNIIIRRDEHIMEIPS